MFYNTCGCCGLFSQESCGHSELTHHIHEKNRLALLLWFECSHFHTGPSYLLQPKAQGAFLFLCLAIPFLLQQHKTLKNMRQRAPCLKPRDEIEMCSKLFTCTHPTLLRSSTTLFPHLPEPTNLRRALPTLVTNAKSYLEIDYVYYDYTCLQSFTDRLDKYLYQ